MRKEKRMIGLLAGACFFAVLSVEMKGSAEIPDNLILVNSTHKIPDGYETGLVELSNGRSVAEAVYPDLQEMFDTMRNVGIYPVVGEGFRTREEQQSLMDERIEQYREMGYGEEEAAAEAERWVAIPGTSEHELGLALDINQVEPSGEWDVYNWLADHAWEYGFILRYPEGKEEITGIGYEPWHYRYVGREDAIRIRDSGLCLEEYLEQNYPE